MFINKDDFVYRIENDDNLLKEEKAESILTGALPIGGKSGVDIPLVMREAIGIIANTSGESVREIAKALDIDKNTVFDYKHGKVGQSDKTLAAKLLKDGLDESLGKIRNKAIDRVVKTLESITDEDLENSGAATLSQIAANLSKVIASTMPKSEEKPTNNIYNTVFYSPETKTEEAYPVIEVG